MMGKMRVQGQAHGRFWARVFQLEEEVGIAQRSIDKMPPKEGKRINFASMPVVAEHTVDDRLKFVYFLIFSIDRLGIDDVYGAIWMGDKTSWDQMHEQRDKVADDVLGKMNDLRPFDEIKVIDSGKE